MYGEREGGLHVLPHWCFHELPDRSVDFIVNTNSLPEMAAATARGYLDTMKRVLRGKFFSVNQEAGMEAPLTGRQHCLAQLMEEAGGFHLLNRSRYWMWQGYLEEVYAQASTDERSSPPGEHESPELKLNLVSVPVIPRMTNAVAGGPIHHEQS